MKPIRLSLYADDLTGFLKDNLSLVNFLRLIQDYGSCSGLKINHDKSEIMLLGNCAYTLEQVSAVSGNLKIFKKLLPFWEHTSPMTFERNKN